MMLQSKYVLFFLTFITDGLILKEASNHIKELTLIPNHLCAMWVPY